MFSLFSNPHCSPAAGTLDENLNALFRLLGDLDDSHSSRYVVPTPCRAQTPQRPQHFVSRTVTRTFKPRFDARETATAYELRGELPGVSKEDVNIEFTDPDTLVVSGRVERTYNSRPGAETGEQATHPAAAPESSPEAKTADVDDDAASHTSSNDGWHHATVEDDPEDPATPSGAATPTETPKTEVVKPATPETTTPPVQVAPQPSAQAATNEKYWLRERSIGEFSRVFRFPLRVEHDKVSASLENGVLSVSVPKAPKHTVRRIAVL